MKVENVGIFLCLLFVCAVKLTSAQETQQEIDSLSKLRTLRFEDEGDGYCLLYMPSWLKYCNNVEEVTFYKTTHIGLTEIIKGLTHLPKLKSVGFEYMNLKTLPKDIALLKGLKAIGLSGNPIKTIPKEIGECKELESISLSDASLNKKSFVFLLTSFPKLRYLSMEACNVSSIPDEICLPPLGYINFYYNPIHSVPECLFSSKTLTKLLISYPSREAKQLQTINVDSVRSVFLKYGKDKVLVD